MSNKKYFVAILVMLAITLTASDRAVFRGVKSMAVSEGASYTVSERAAPEIPLEKLCGLVIPEDFEAQMRMRRAPLPQIKRALPERFDWRAKNACTTPKQQGSCGSCWAFAAIGILESAVLIEDGNYTDLSEQDMVNCNPYGYGCQGGWVDCLNFFQDYGSVNERTIPYVGYEQACKQVSRSYKIRDWGYVSDSVSSIKQAIYQYGPVFSVVCSDSSMQYYSGGIFNHDNYGNVNHAIVLVGWDDSLGKNGCWILRNSWGTRWGENGYMYIEYGNCGVGSKTAAILY